MNEKSAPPPGFNIPSDGTSSTASAPPVSAAESSPNPPYPNMSSAYPGPPPSYQSAMTYPASAPAYPPNPVPNAAPYPTQPIYVPPSITMTQLPQPPRQHQQPTQRIVVQVAQGPACSHCGIVMRRESDICCIICLVLLAILTFPIGLLFICCLPCAAQMRCPGCGRSS